MAYATLPEFYASGVTAEAFAAAGTRVIEAVDTAADTMTLSNHGFALDKPLRIQARSGALPGGAPASSVCFAKPVANSVDLFQIAATLGGSAIDLTSAGTGVIQVVPQDIDVDVQQALDFRADWIDQHLPAHATPLVTPPASIKMVNCHLAAFDLVVTRGLSNQAFQESSKAIQDRAAAAQKFLDGMMTGRPLRGATVDQTPTIAENAAVVYSLDPAGDLIG